MNIKEMIEKYGIAPETKDFGAEFTGRLIIRNVKSLKADNAEEMIRDKKLEILDHFKNEKAEKEAAKKEYEEKVASIEGLQEIQKASRELAEWEMKFQKSFDGEYAVGGLGVGKRPNHNIDEMLERYPRAAAYLKAKKYADKQNFELSKIGEKALHEVVYGNFHKAMSDMDTDLKKFTEKHMWD